MVIEEVEEAELYTKGEESKTEAIEPVITTTPSKPHPLPLPHLVQQHKDNGNSLFRCGQYGSAVQCYTDCIKLLKIGNIISIK